MVDASMIEFQSDWEIAVYYSRISGDLEKLYEFINSNEDFVKEAFQNADGNPKTKEIMTKLMNLSIYGSNESKHQSASEADEMMLMAEQLFLSEIRAYLSELRLHIVPILKTKVPEKYSDIIS